MADTAPSRAKVRALALTYARQAVLREHRLRGASEEFLAGNAKLIETNAKLRLTPSLLALARINLTREARNAVS